MQCRKWEILSIIVEDTFFFYKKNNNLFCSNLLICMIWSINEVNFIHIIVNNLCLVDLLNQPWERSISGTWWNICYQFPWYLASGSFYLHLLNCNTTRKLILISKPGISYLKALGLVLAKNVSAKVAASQREYFPTSQKFPCKISCFVKSSVNGLTF